MTIKEGMLNYLEKNTMTKMEVEGKEVSFHGKMYNEIFQDGLGVVIDGKKIPLEDVPRELLQDLIDIVDSNKDSDNDNYENLINDLKEEQENYQDKMKVSVLYTDEYRTEVNYGMDGKQYLSVIPDNDIVKKGMTDESLEGFVEKVLYDFGIFDITAYNVLDMPEVDLNRAIGDLAYKMWHCYCQKVTVKVKDKSRAETRKVFLPENMEIRE